MLSVFFWGCFPETVPLHFAVFQSSTCLRFFVRRVFRNELWDGSPEFLGRIFGPKNAPFASRKRQRQSSPFLRFFFRSSIFVTARFCGGFWATNSVICVGCFFAGSGCAFLFGFSYLIQGVLVFLPFSGLWGRCFGVRFLSSSSFFFLLSFSGPAWVLFLSLLCSCRQDLNAGSRQVRLSICLCSVSSFFSLPPGRLPYFLALFFLFLLSFSLACISIVIGPTESAQIMPCCSGAF